MWFGRKQLVELFAIICSSLVNLEVGGGAISDAG